MDLILYNNTSEYNRIDKIKYLHKIIKLEGSLREATSIISPQILIELNPETLLTNIINKKYIVDDSNEYVTTDGKVKLRYDVISKILTCNYAFIPDFNRYYFINDITSVRQNLWRLSLHVDVLMSYKQQIRNLYAFVVRNEFDFNKYVKDDLVSYYYDKDVTEYIPDKGDMVNKTFTSSTNILYDNIIITCINDLISANFDNVNPPDSSLPIVSGNTSGDAATYKIYGIFPSSLSMLSKKLITADDTLASFILSIVAYPFLIDIIDSPMVLRLGNHDVEDDEEHTNAVYVDALATNLSKYNVIADFTITSESFLDYEPYTQYEIYLPYLGWVGLSADNILNNRIIVYYIINYQTGTSQVNIYDVTNKKVIYTTNTQLGIRIPITSTNAREVNDQHNSNNIGLGVGLLTGAIATVGGIFTYNPVAVAGGVMGMGASIAKYVQNENTNYQRATGSVSSGQSGLYLPQDVKIRTTRLKPKNYNDDYAKLFGKPLNEYRKLEGLQGFTTVGNVHLENIGSATSQEITELDTLLKSGIIL